MLYFVNEERQREVTVTFYEERHERVTVTF
jgi:hypothetical protein